MSEEVIFCTDFSGGIDSQLKWLYEPKKTECIKAIDKTVGGLQVHMDKEQDYWQKTYYTPTLIKDDGHVLYYTSKESPAFIETTFKLNAVNQFDQAGLMVRLDSEHWIKTGLEFVDGACRLSVVVTNVYSDWSTQSWPSSLLHIRVHRQGNDFVVEASADGKAWDFIRICHLDVGADVPLAMGLMACAPMSAGGNVVFEKLMMKKTSGYHHTS